jgi:hypothetical protein
MNLHIANATIHLHHGATSALQDFAASAVFAPASMTVSIAPPAHGEPWPGQGGRYICTLPPLLGLPERHLIAGEGETEDLTYGPDIDVPGAYSHFDGAANTSALLTTGKTHPAAEWARGYTADGHTDFFLPSQLDLFMAYIYAGHLFKKSGWYRSSTQGSRDDAFVQDFEHGSSNWNVKGGDSRVRAFRVIPTSTL